MSVSSFAKIAIAAMITMGAVPSMAAVVVSNPFDIGAGGTTYLSFGEPDSITYGQTFITPDATNVRLDSFSFFVHSIDVTTSNMKGYVAEWNGMGIAGAPLFTGPLISANYANFTEVVVSTGGLTLDPSKTYVAYMSAAGLFDGTSDSLEFGTNNFQDSYLNGAFVYDDDNASGDPLGKASGALWDGCINANCEDLAFNLVFNATGTAPAPEPMTLALLGLGLVVGIGASRRRRPLLSAKACGKGQLWGSVCNAMG